MSRTGIIMFERGERIPTLFVCKALADALGKPLHVLVRLAEVTEASAGNHPC